MQLDAGEFGIEITPYIVEHLGIHTIAYATLPGSEPFIGLFEGNPDIEDGKPLKVSFSIADVHLFDGRGLAVY
jgi:multiple sugar transport system ATP-binding protein